MHHHTLITTFKLVKPLVDNKCMCFVPRIHFIYVFYTSLNSETK